MYDCGKKQFGQEIVSKYNFVIVCFKKICLIYLKKYFIIKGCCRNYLFLNKFRHKQAEALMFVKSNYKMQYASHKRIQTNKTEKLETCFHDSFHKSKNAIFQIFLIYFERNNIL